jgi:hypothetical protein
MNLYIWLVVSEDPRLMMPNISSASRAVYSKLKWARYDYVDIANSPLSPLFYITNKGQIEVATVICTHVVSANRSEMTRDVERMIDATQVCRDMWTRQHGRHLLMTMRCERVEREWY